MMHDQSGQELLRERFIFATSKDKRESPLTTWSGNARDKWRKGIKAIEDYEVDLRNTGLIVMD
jgi:hypothetical protein